MAPAALGLGGGALAAWGLDAYAADIQFGDGPLLLARIAREPWRALWIGVLCGTPAVLIEIAALQIHRAHFARLPFMAAKERRTAEVRLRNAWAWVPTIVGMFLASVVAWRLVYAVPVAALGALGPLLLAYPIERAIYRDVKARRGAEPS